MGVEQGIILAIVLSLILHVRRHYAPHDSVVSWDEAGRYTQSPPTPGTLSEPGLVIYRFDAPLFFANTRTFDEQVRELTHTDPRPRWIIIAAEPITDVDTTAADMLVDLDELLNEQQISLVFAEMKDPVRRKIDRFELTKTINPAHFYPTVEAAVSAYEATVGAQPV